MRSCATEWHLTGLRFATSPGAVAAPSRSGAQEQEAPLAVKSLALVLSLIARPFRRQDTRLFIWMIVLLLVVMVGVYSATFHEIMECEGHRYNWPTAVDWTIVTMSALGFRDITFESDLGRLFSVVMLVTGASFILVLITFAFIQFVFTPWMARREEARAQRRRRLDRVVRVARSDGDLERARRRPLPGVRRRPGDVPDAVASVGGAGATDPGG